MTPVTPWALIPTYRIVDNKVQVYKYIFSYRVCGDRGSRCSMGDLHLHSTFLSLLAQCFWNFWKFWASNMSADTAWNLMLTMCLDKGYNQLYPKKITSGFVNIFTKYQQFTSKKTLQRHCEIKQKKHQKNIAKSSKNIAKSENAMFWRQNKNIAFWCLTSCYTTPSIMEITHLSGRLSQVK